MVLYSEKDSGLSTENINSYSHDIEWQNVYDHKSTTQALKSTDVYFPTDDTIHYDKNSRPMEPSTTKPTIIHESIIIYDTNDVKNAEQLTKRWIESLVDPTILVKYDTDNIVYGNLTHLIALCPDVFPYGFGGWKEAKLACNTIIRILC